MRAKFFMGPKDGAEEDVQTSDGFAPDLYQYLIPLGGGVVTKEKPVRYNAYYDLQEVKDNVAYYKYRCTA